MSDTPETQHPEHGAADWIVLHGPDDALYALSMEALAPFQLPPEQVAALEEQLPRSGTA